MAEDDDDIELEDETLEPDGGNEEDAGDSDIEPRQADCFARGDVVSDGRPGHALLDMATWIPVMLSSID